MFQTKIITATNPGSLETLINECLKEYASKHYLVTNILYNTIPYTYNPTPNNQSVLFSALITYQPK